MIRREPYVTDIFDFRRNFDDLLSRMLTPYWDRPERFSSATTLAWIPPVESYIDQNRFQIRLALPGVKPNEVNLQVHGNELSISGERKQDITPAEERTFQREIAYGAFERIVSLPEGVQGDKIEAAFKDGVLQISVPLSEKAVPRKIEIKGESGEGKKLAA
ncbi:MAG: Hsp20/alpha crystallin family protein [Terriglobales bacterium]